MSFQPIGVVTLTTDFGMSDGYVGAMKGVILSTDLRLSAIDIAHDVNPQSLTHGALTVAASCPRFPLGTVHVVVVDPGVGSRRSPMCALAGGHAFIGPDNGVLSEVTTLMGGIDAAYRIERSFGPVSNTFHGRDVFAPAGAALAAGLMAPRDLGREFKPVVAGFPQPKSVDEGLICRILACDHFGNCITNVRANAVTSFRAVMLPDGSNVPFVATYSDVDSGEGLALVGSSGWLEVAVRDGSAKDKFGLKPGATLLALTQ